MPIKAKLLVNQAHYCSEQNFMKLQQHCCSAQCAGKLVASPAFSLLFAFKGYWVILCKERL